MPAIEGRVTGLLVCLVGLVAIVSVLAGSASAPLGRLHWFLTLTAAVAYGIGVLAAGILLLRNPAAADRDAVWTKIALGLAAGSAAFTIYCLVWPMPIAAWVLLGYLAALAVLLPSQLGVTILAGALVLHLLLTWINYVKSGLTGAPLTVLDIRIAMTDSSAFWDSLGLPQSTRRPILGAIGIALGAWLIALLALATHALLRLVPADFSGRRFALFCSLLLMTCLHFQALYAVAAKDESVWDLERLTLLAERMGILPFMAYSYRLESRSEGDIFRTGNDSKPPDDRDLHEAVTKYLDLGGVEDADASRLPNIMVVLAESTFDPGAAFRLKGRWNQELFTPGPRTAAAGPLRVNAVGGGTWITEFETIVGLDSRLFGYAGVYTHVSLAPYVNHSFATYLRDRGYHSLAFFPTGGDFYNARNAYQSYGFDRIYDSSELVEGGWIGDDQVMAARVSRELGPEPAGPFYSYVLFLGNHSPHDCGTADARSFSARFADNADHVPNCALADYLTRLGTTTAAVDSLVEYLADVEARTGRPFVLMTFGDHQPYTFTDDGHLAYDYRPMRKPPGDLHTTFFHFLTSPSLQGRLRCCSVDPPAALVPTLLSGFVASAPEHVYLGLNLWLYDQCGSDAVRRDFGGWMEALTPGADAPSQACRSAYLRALAGYRASGIMELGDE